MTAQLLDVEKRFQSYRNPRILLVEDNDVNRMLLSDYLVYCGYDVQSLSNGSNFFPCMEKYRPELILLDLKLPDVDGYSLLEQVQQQPDLSPIPIIVVSAFAFKADCERAISLGACRYFVKPVNLNQLTEAIKEELATHSK